MAAIVEVVAVSLIIRPVVAWQGPAFHYLARPFRTGWYGRLHPRAEHRVLEGTDEDVDSAWGSIVADLLEAEYEGDVAPGHSNLGSTFVLGTPLHAQARNRGWKLANAGLRVKGPQPELVSLSVADGVYPIFVEVVVDHPPRYLQDADGRVVGTKAGERRAGFLWIVRSLNGGYRIAESVDAGSGRLPGEIDGDQRASDAVADNAEAVDSGLAIDLTEPAVGRTTRAGQGDSRY